MNTALRHLYCLGLRVARDSCCTFRISPKAQLEEELRMRRHIYRIVFLFLGEHLMTPVVPGFWSVVESIINAASSDLLQTLYAGQYKSHFGENQSFAAQYSEELEAHRYHNRTHQQ